MKDQQNYYFTNWNISQTQIDAIGWTFKCALVSVCAVSADNASVYNLTRKWVNFQRKTTEI